jgi:hypothetical protein
MTATDIAAETFARIVQLQDQVEALADALGKALDEIGRLRQALGLDIGHTSPIAPGCPRLRRDCQTCLDAIGPNKRRGGGKERKGKEKK